MVSFFYIIINRVKLFHLTNHCSVRPPNSPGKSSYINNIPLPKFEMIEGFLYASIPSVLAYVLGMGLPILDLQGETFNQYPQTKLSSSAKAKQILDNATRNNKSYDIISYITEWSDSFDPNTSSKNNRASVYVKSITFVPASNSAFPSSFYTFPLCIGHGKTIKLELEKRMVLDLEAFKKDIPLSFWDSSANVKKSVYLDILLSMQDQPERRAGLSLMMGNSRMHPRFGISCDYVAIQQSQRSCKDCYKRLTKKEEDNITCPNCLNWSLNIENKLCHFKAPENYPDDCPFLLNEKYLQPRVLTTDLLTSIVKLSVSKVKENIWKKQNVFAFLGTYGIHQEYINYLMESIKNDTEIEIPFTWQRNLSIHDHVETIMHLLFLGVTKSTFNDIHAWLRSKNLFTKFLAMVDKILQPIQNLRLEWCKIIPYGTGKFGGHVSENYLAMARILKWFLCILNQFKSTNNETDGGTMLDIIHMTTALYAMLSHTLQKNVTKELIHSVDQHIKLFLNAYADFDIALHGKKNVSWIKKYNFLSLLNLPEQMKNFGPLLNLWEGGIVGEKIISTMKPEIKSGLRKNWQRHLFVKWMRKYFFTLNNNNNKKNHYNSPVQFHY